MAAKILTSTFTNKLKVHRDKEIFADAIAHNFLTAMYHRRVFLKY
ncbi:MAG: hypothetical protein ABI840_07335 [bacterium]